MVKWLIAAILLLPLAEIVAFVLVAMAIGLGPAFLLLVLTMILGALVLRQAGRSQLVHFRAAVANSRVAGIDTDGAGLLTVLAGLLLFLPGFLTSLVGLALLLAPVRSWCSRVIRRAAGRRAPGDPSVLDLDPDEWRQVPERTIEDSAKRQDQDRDRD